LLQRFADSLDRQVKSAFAADGKVVVFFLPVNVNGKRQVFAGLEEVQLFFQQQGIRAKINILLAATRPSTIFSIWECISGSPPGIDTIGAPHSSTALKHSSGESSCFST